MKRYFPLQTMPGCLFVQSDRYSEYLCRNIFHCELTRLVIQENEQKEMEPYREVLCRDKYLAALSNLNVLRFRYFP